MPPKGLFECEYYGLVRCKGQTNLIPGLGYGNWCLWKIASDPVSVRSLHKCPGERREQRELNKWRCPCGHVNSGNRDSCKKCGHHAPAAPARWICVCGQLNTDDEDVCGRCGKLRDGVYTKCPDCGRYIENEEGYTCAACGKKSCGECTGNTIDDDDEVTDRVERVDASGNTAYLCAKCREEAEVKEHGSCDICEVHAAFECVCGARRCERHATEIFSHFDQKAWCPSCNKWICKNCIEPKIHFLGRTTYHCRICGKKLSMDDYRPHF